MIGYSLSNSSLIGPGGGELLLGPSAAAAGVAVGQPEPGGGAVQGQVHRTQGGAGTQEGVLLSEAEL